MISIYSIKFVDALKKALPNGFNGSGHTSHFIGGQVYIFCGNDGNILSATWIFNPISGLILYYFFIVVGSLTQLSTNGNISPRTGLASVYNNVTNEVYLIAGQGQNSVYYSDIWVLKDSVLLSSAPSVIPSVIPSVGPSFIPSVGPSFIPSVSPSSRFTLAPTTDLNVMYQVAVTGTNFSPRDFHSTILIPSTNQIIIIGGQDASSIILSDMWIFNTTTSKIF